MRGYTSDDVAHRQVVVGDHIQSPLCLGNIVVRPGHESNRPGVRGGQHLREAVEREGEHAFLAGRLRFVAMGFQIVVEEHLVGDDGDAAFTTQGDQASRSFSFDV